MSKFITDKQLADLIEWHGKDGTRKGDLTTRALKEIADMRHLLEEQQRAIKLAGKTLRSFVEYSSKDDL